MGQNREQAGRIVVILALLAGLIGPGCSVVKTRNLTVHNAVRNIDERRRAARLPADLAREVLVEERLADLADRDPAAAASKLEARLAARPDAAGALTLAELSFRLGVERERARPAEAMAYLRDSAALATLALREPVTRGFDPESAVALHNQAVARLVRLVQAESKREPGTPPWRQVAEERGLALSSPTPALAPERFADLLVIDDIRLTGMQHIYRNAGFGVPLVVHRRVEPASSPDPLDQLHPRELRAAATAVVTPVGGLRDREWRREPVTLAFLDPYHDRSLRLGDREVTVAGDRTTPRAMQVAEGTLPTLEMTGLFDSDFRRPGVEAGLYLFRPYEPGKIPVVLVHGLFSSPRSFLQNMNELENDPIIAARYQFWVFMYPTGLPIPTSAAHLRESLRKVRDTLDPDHADATLDRMVLVGHSMGGLLSKMMVQNSGMALWNAAFSRPVADLEASPATRKLLVDSLIFRPLPTIRRVVFVATPHLGSPIADQPFGRAIASLVKRTSAMAALSKELVELNGPDLIADDLRRIPFNAVSNLRTDSPILRTLHQLPISPRVPYHSIIPQLAGTLPTDGVVEYPSAHLDGAESETIVNGSHFAMPIPAVTAEVRRILLLHLDTEDAPL